jgi:MerR family transcriptional regulator/heat shock protein HspR
MTGPAPDPTRGVYGIAVAAELVGIDPQSLRLYERRGLLEPARTDGGTRRYSSHDLDRIRRIGDLLDAGLNLAGIAMVLDLEARNTQLLTDKDDRTNKAHTRRR